MLKHHQHQRCTPSPQDSGVESNHGVKTELERPPSSDKELFQWYYLPTEVKSHIFTYFTDGEKIAIVDLFPEITPTIKSFTFKILDDDYNNYKSQIDLFSRFRNSIIEIKFYFEANNEVINNSNPMGIYLRIAENLISEIKSIISVEAVNIVAYYWVISNTLEPLIPSLLTSAKFNLILNPLNIPDTVANSDGVLHNFNSNKTLIYFDSKLPEKLYNPDRVTDIFIYTNVLNYDIIIENYVMQLPYLKNVEIVEKTFSLELLKIINICMNKVSVKFVSFILTSVQLMNDIIIRDVIKSKNKNLTQVAIRFGDSLIFYMDGTCLFVSSNFVHIPITDFLLRFVKVNKIYFRKLDSDQIEADLMRQEINDFNIQFARTRYIHFITFS